MEQLIECKTELVLPPATEPEHHSVVDWDFQSGLTYNLYTGLYYVAPSSLRMKTASRLAIKTVLCRRANCLDLPQGQMSAFYRAARTDRHNPYATFCNQAVLGSTGYANSYIIRFHQSNTWFRKYVGGVQQWNVFKARSHPNNTWFGERVTWWMVGAVLYFQFDYWNGAAWVKYWDRTDATPLWQESGVNRLGPAYRSDYVTPAYVYYDEFYLGGPV